MEICLKLKTEGFSSRLNCVKECHRKKCSITETNEGMAHYFEI